jgi:hypothetical protein
MKKNTRLFACTLILSIFIISLFSPIEKISHELVSFTIDLLQPDETFQVVQTESKFTLKQKLSSKPDQVSKPKLEVEEVARQLAQSFSSLPQEVSHDSI